MADDEKNLTDAVLEELDDATGDPPTEDVTVEADMTVMPSVREQLDEAGAGTNFVTFRIGTVTIDGQEVAISAAAGDGIVASFPDGTRVLLPALEFVHAAARAAQDAEVVGEGEDPDGGE